MTFIQNHIAEISAAVLGVILAFSHARLKNNYSNLAAYEGKGVKLKLSPGGSETNEIFASGPLAAQRRLAISVLQNLPIPIWTRDPDGAMTFTNRAFDQISSTGLADSFVFQPHGALSGGNDKRRISCQHENTMRWFDIQELTDSTGLTFGCAVAADATVKAEEGLQRLMATMTQTFAHLQVGVAIFDRNKTLTLFNPALVDILNLQPVWLVRTPTLREFLEKLREQRKIPGNSDFQEWRRILTQLSALDQEEHYCQDWLLPGGQTLRVTGRQQTNGAFALLFDDISLQVKTGQNLHSETELFKTVSNRLHEAMAVFDPAGTLIKSNLALNNIWGVECRPDHEQSEIRQLTAVWREFCRPSPFWGELRDYATGTEVRSTWSAVVHTLGNRRILCSVSPLPDGATLVLLEEEPVTVEKSGARLDIAAASGN